MKAERILFTSGSYFPDTPNGVARITYDLARQFAREGREVWLLCYGQESPSDPTHVFEDGVHVVRYTISGRGSFNPLRPYHVVALVKGVLRNTLPKAPNLVSGNDLFGYLGAVLAYGGTAKTCYTIHSPAVEEMAISWHGSALIERVKRVFGLPVIRALEGWVLRHSDALTALSNFTCARIETLYGADLASRIETIPGWVDSDQFRILDDQEVKAFRLRFKWPLDRPVFFSLRRLQKRNGLENYIRALALLKQRRYSFFAAIGGSGSMRKELEEMVHGLQLDDEVAFCGRISEADLPLAYGSCDASVVPTSDLECFGLIAIEAMACGRPVLATPVGSLPEVVGRFDQQWIAKSSSPEDISRILSEFLDGQLGHRTPTAISEFAREHFQFKTAFLSYGRVFDSILTP